MQNLEDEERKYFEIMFRKFTVFENNLKNDPEYQGAFTNLNVHYANVNRHKQDSEK